MTQVRGMALVRCPRCQQWKVRVARPFGKYATRRHPRCGVVEVPSTAEVRDVAANPPGSVTGSGRSRR